MFILIQQLYKQKHFCHYVCLGVWEYIEKTRDMVHDLQTRVQAAKDNVEAISQIMTKWSEAPLYERKEGKKEGLLNLEVKFYWRSCSE